MSKNRDRLSPNLHTNHNHITITNITIYNLGNEEESYWTLILLEINKATKDDDYGGGRVISMYS